MKTCLSNAFYSLAYNRCKYSKFSLCSWAHCAQVIASLSWWPLHVSQAPGDSSTDGTMQAQNWEQNKADWSLKDLLQKISQSCWTNFPASLAYWVCFLLSHPSSVQLQEGPHISGHQAGASRAPGWIMSVFQPGTDGVRKFLGPRRAFCKLMFGL